MDQRKVIKIDKKNQVDIRSTQSGKKKKSANKYTLKSAMASRVIHSPADPQMSVF